MTETDHDRVREAADWLVSAMVTKRPISAVRELIGASEIHNAYAVQHEVVARYETAGAVVVGRKILLPEPEPKFLAERRAPSDPVARLRYLAWLAQRQVRLARQFGVEEVHRRAAKEPGDEEVRRVIVERRR